MYPILVKIFGYPVHSFGFMVAVGFLAGYFWMQHSARKMGENPDRIADLFLWVLISGIVGARLLYIMIHPCSLAEAFMIWKGGLVLYGGVLAAILAGAWIVKKKGMDFLQTADIAMPCVMLGLSIGRIGCLLVGDCYGKPAPDLPWAISFPNVPGSMMPTDRLNVPLHPTQIYMALNAILLSIVLTVVLKKRSFKGQVFCLSLILYSVTRSVIEIFRGDNEARGYLGSLSTSQWISAAVIVFALWKYISLRQKSFRKEHR